MDGGGSNGHEGHVPTALRIQTSPSPSRGRSEVTRADEDNYPASPRVASTPNLFSRRQTGLEIDDYFVGDYSW